MNNQPAERIILRRKQSFRTVAGAGPWAIGSVASVPSGQGNLPSLDEPVLEHAHLTPREVAEEERDPEVLVIADAMPLKLIEPIGPPEITAAATGNTWGVESVRAHTSSFTGNGVVVAVLDTGINPTHVAFSGVNLVRRNFTQSLNDDDENGHGTHCAGTIFGRDVNGLRIGVARGVTTALIGKVLGPGGGSSATLATAINWAYENGANVISMSLGIDFAGFVARLIAGGMRPEPATSLALEQYRANVNLFSSLTMLLEQSNAFSQACVVIAASGNESDRPRYEIAVAPPAAGNGMISVGALQRSAAGNLSVAPFSNTHCNLSGPGVSITSSWIGSNTAMNTIAGTSMATPHVAGCAALWAEQQKLLTGVLTTNNLAARTLASAMFIPGASFNDIGNGMVQAP